MFRSILAVASLVFTVMVFASSSFAKTDGATEGTGGQAEATRILFYGFRMINDSMEEQSEAETNRLRLLEDIMRKRFSKEGFEVVPVPDEMAEQIAAGPNIGECNGCEAENAKKLNADLMAWGTVQKISNLIININIYIADVETNNFRFIKSVDIRSNTDKSWTRGMEWMLEYYTPDQEKLSTGN